MIKFFRWLFGYVEFYFKGGFLEGFINDCYKNSLGIYDLERIDDTLVGFIRVSNYKKLHSIAYKHGGIVKIIKRRGPIFAFNKLKNRWGLLSGVIAFLFIINFLSGFVWDIEVVGNTKVATDELVQILNDNGVTIGTHWSSINRNAIKDYILSSLDDCAWAHINRIGSKLILEVSESVEKPNIVEKRVPSNLKAKKDGVIVKTRTHGGWQVAQVGDSVKKGDLLVSGVYESEHNKTNVYAHASGEYIANVKENVELFVSRKQTVKNYDNPKKYKTLIFYNLKLPLYIGKINFNSCDIQNDEIFLRFNDKNLPIGITTITVNHYTPTEILLNDNELTTLINSEVEKKIQNELGQYEILGKNIDILLNESEACACGYVNCLEDIAEIINITKDDNILCSIAQNNIKEKSRRD